MKNNLKYTEYRSCKTCILKPNLTVGETIKKFLARVFIPFTNLRTLVYCGSTVVNYSGI